MAGVQKLYLNNLNINVKNASIVGIIIAKSNTRKLKGKRKLGESRSVMSFTLRDSEVDTINADVWGSEYFVSTFFEQFIVGEVVEIICPKISVKQQLDIYKPQVTSPFYLSLTEGQSEINKFTGDPYLYVRLLHIPTKPCAGYCGISEVLQLKEQKDDLYVDLLVAVKSVKPIKLIKTKAGMDMAVRSVEILDNSTPASITLDVFDMDTIRRAESWIPMESVLFIADARVSWRFAVHVQMSSRTVITHQPHTCEAEALSLYIQNQSQTRGAETAAWAAWSGERETSATVSHIVERRRSGETFCAALHAMLTHLDLEELINENVDELRVRFADHTGELSARIPVNVLEDTFGYSVLQMKMMSYDERNAARWRFLLEQCGVRLAVTPPRLVVLSLRIANAADSLPLY